MAKDTKFKFLNVVVAASGKASLMIYGQIGSDEGVNAEMVAAELIALQQEFQNIDVHINSNGGEVFAGIAIYNALRSSTSNINIYVDGVAASIAGVIALCGKPMYMSRYSRLMLHQVSGCCSGSAREMRQCADLIEGLETSLAEMISSKCGMPAENVRAEFFDGMDHWMTAEEAQRRRLCDGIFDVAGSDALGAAPTAEAVYAFANSLQIKPSNPDNMDFLNELKKESSFKDLSEEQALAQIRTLANEAAKVPALEAKVESLTKQLNAEKERATEAYLNRAVSEGRITQEQVDTYKALMAADEASTRKIIDALPAKSQTMNIKEYLRNAGGAAAGEKKDLAQMSWDEIDQAERLSELKNEHPDLYKAKYLEKFGA